LAAWATASFAAEPAEPPEHVIKVLRTTNKAHLHRYVPKVYDIRNNNPYALLRWVRRTAQIEEGGFYFFGKPDADGSVNSGKILVILPEHMLDGVDQLMQAIDRAGLTSTSGESFFYYLPKYRHVKDAGFTKLIQAIRGTSGDFETDDEANRFLVYAAPSKLADVQNWLKYIDAPPPQVMVEATVYEVQVDNESKIGLDYVAWKNGPGRNAVAVGAFYESEKWNELDNANALLNSGAGNVYGLPGHKWRARGHNVAWFLDVPSAFFDFLVVKGKARVMTSAKVAARNLIPARLFAGDTILYYETCNGPAPRAGVRPQNLPLDPLDVPEDDDGNKTNIYPDNRTVVGTKTTRMTAGQSGVELKVTPVIAQNEIQLEIETTVVSHTGFDSNGAPVLAARESESQVRVRDGEEIVLGGYSREVFVQRADKIPVLGSLPLLGYLFGGDANTTERRHVVIVLTPHVIRDFSAMEQDPSKINALLVKHKALGKAELEVPDTEVGFDQWLLDEEEK
jgi:type II secretory pathway component GspD/PulD (secretin)